MTANFKHTGCAIDYTPVTDVSAGEVVVLGNLIGIAKLDIQAGSLGSLHLEGVFEMPRASGGVIAPGWKMYWDDTAKIATTDDASGANVYIGKTIKESGDTDTTAVIRLDQ